MGQAFDLGMAEQKLNRAQVAGTAIDQRRFGSVHRMRGELARIEADAADPLGHEARILPRGQGRVSASWKQVLAWLATSHTK